MYTLRSHWENQKENTGNTPQGTAVRCGAGKRMLEPDSLGSNTSSATRLFCDPEEEPELSHASVPLHVARTQNHLPCGGVLRTE